MGLVIDWTDILARYAELDKLPNGSSPEVQNNLIAMAEADCHSRLSSRFTTPFSTSNLTARDLCVDILYIQTQMTRQPEKAKGLKEYLDMRILDLLEGRSKMIDSSGIAALTAVGDTIWSSTEDYPPVFGVSDIIKAEPSSGQLYDEDVNRGEYR